MQDPLNRATLHMMIICFSEFLFTLQVKFQILESFTNLDMVFSVFLCDGMEDGRWNGEQMLL